VIPFDCKGTKSDGLPVQTHVSFGLKKNAMKKSRLQPSLLIPSFFVLLSWFPLFLSAQQPECSCRENFDWMRQKIATNYAGYHDKVSAQTQPALDAHTEKLLARAEGTADTTCLRLMGEWLRFFKDGHLQIAAHEGTPAAQPPTLEDIRARFAAEPRMEMTEMAAKRNFDKKGEKTAPIEGIWRNLEGSYRVAIVSLPFGADRTEGYAGVILKADSAWWMPGQIKFKLDLPEGKYFKATYFMRDHSPNAQRAFTDGQILAFNNTGLWRKEYPEQVRDELVANFQSPFAPPGGMPSNHFELKKLDDQTLLLRIPTFDHTLRSKTDSLLLSNKALLETTPHLIIDVRNNGGGSDISYHKIIPYLYTDPIQVTGAARLATKDNRDKYVQMQHDKNLPVKYRLYARYMKMKMKRRYGQFLKDKNGAIKMKKTLPYPQKVAILTNEGCGSSCEEFVLAARQSKKVTLIGTHTAGVLDYANMHFMPYPCAKWTLGWATSRSNRLDLGQGIDNVGVVPQVQPGAEVRDWVLFAKAYLNKR